VSLPRKGRRTIRVGEQAYYWMIRFGYIPDPSGTVGDLTIVLLIEAGACPGRRIEAYFEGKRSIPFLWEDVRQNLAITPQTVRGVIDHAVAEGWDPQRATSTFIIDHAETLFPDCKAGDESWAT